MTFPVLTKLELDYLAVCDGEVRRLPYGSPLLGEAQRRPTELGYIKNGYDDDQPTSWITEAGKLARMV